MTQSDFTLTFLTDQSEKTVFDAINNVYGWWSEDFKGASTQIGDEFEVRFGDVHYSRHQLTAVIPNQKVAWLVTDSNLNFLADKSEWTGTDTVFDISRQDGQTVIHFTHHGLVPEIQCFKDCSKGWTYFLQDSLMKLINTGKGQPNIVKAAAAHPADTVCEHVASSQKTA